MHTATKAPWFENLSAMIGTLANNTWTGHYQHCQQRSEFKLHFESICKSLGTNNES